MNQGNPLELARRLTPLVDAFILDTTDAAEDRVGGTGLQHDWSLSRDLVAECAKPVILAGGLHAGNVTDAIRMVRPFGVDANSRLKDAAGHKDARKVAAYLTTAKRAFLNAAESPDPSIRHRGTTGY
jgi:phosphoribosylanthranilate isomerase